MNVRLIVRARMQVPRKTDLLNPRAPIVMLITVGNSAGNATLSLMQGIFQRAGVLVLLIASLLAPYGRCQSPGRTTSHTCCVQDSTPKASVTGNCCIVRSQLPAVLEERPALGLTAVPATPEFVPLPGPVTLLDASIANPVTQTSPPPGASVLRI
jgi:hypothetical protein